MIPIIDFKVRSAAARPVRGIAFAPALALGPLRRLNPLNPLGPLGLLGLLGPLGLLGLLGVSLLGAPAAQSAEAPAAHPEPPRAPTNHCLASHDGYLRARVAGAVDADIDWADRGTRCEGEAKTSPDGIRLSFRRVRTAQPNLLFVFGVSGVREGEPAHGVGTNVTVIVQGTSHVYSTRSDTRCTADSVTQQPLGAPHAYRVEARGFCTQPARAVHGEGDLLVSRFDFAGIVNYSPSGDESTPTR
jgi:hypothetical protein